jgi:hypothetical protein
VSRGWRLPRLALVCAVLLAGNANSAAAQPVAPASAGASAVAAPHGPWRVADELWDRPRSADLVRAQPGVRAAVRALQAAPAGTSLVIRHGRGQNAQLQAEELRQWLLALALERERVVLGEDAAAGTVLWLALVPRP